MTGPPIPQQEDPVAAYKRKYGAAQQAPSEDPVAKYKARYGTEDEQKKMLQERGIIMRDPQAIHDEYKVGNLGRRMTSENSQEQADLSEPSGTTWKELLTHPRDIPEAAARAFNATEANIARAIPGLPFLQTGARALVRGQSMPEARADIEGEVGRIPGPTRVLGQQLGSLPLVGPLKGLSPAKAGALLGGTSAALADEPINDLGDLGKRAVSTASSAALGGLLGGAIDKTTTAVRAGLAQNPTENLIARQAARARSAHDLYGAALREGKENVVTPAIKSYVSEPDVAKRIQALQQLDEFKGLKPTDPEMLDALYKSLSDEAKTFQKGLTVTDPSKPNTGRFGLRQVRGLQQKLLGAMGAKGEQVIPAPETAPQPKPTLREALDIFDRNKGIAVTRKEGTVAQQMARKALERHSAEQIVQPPLRGAPSEAVVETPPQMPSYQDAVEDFARQSRDIKALARGWNVSRTNPTGTRPTPQQALSKEPKLPETFAEYMKNASPSEQQAALEGILGDVKNAFHEPGWRMQGFRRTVGKAGPLLRSTGTDQQKIVDLLQLLGLTGLNSSLPDR